ncbi:hypothetical protein [Alkalihalobacillus sp. LMS39]|nr:hypothetical protein [Alkalihalobacillus sp. LMS39]
MTGVVKIFKEEKSIKYWLMAIGWALICFSGGNLFLILLKKEI